MTMTNDDLSKQITEITIKFEKMDDRMRKVETSLTRIGTYQYFIMLFLGAGITEVMHYLVTGHP